MDQLFSVSFSIGNVYPFFSPEFSSLNHYVADLIQKNGGEPLAQIVDGCLNFLDKTRRKQKIEHWNKVFSAVDGLIFQVVPVLETSIVGQRKLSNLDTVFFRTKHILALEKAMGDVVNEDKFPTVIDELGQVKLFSHKTDPAQYALMTPNDCYEIQVTPSNLDEESRSQFLKALVISVHLDTKVMR